MWFMCGKICIMNLGTEVVSLKKVVKVCNKFSEEKESEGLGTWWGCH